MKRIVAVALGIGLLVAATREARADETVATSEPTLKRYPPSSVRWKMVLAGITVTGAMWGVSYLTTNQWPDAPGSPQMKIPVVGPWLALGHAGCAATDPDCGALQYVRGVLQVLDGLIQLGGVGIIGEGIFMTTEAEGARPSKSTGFTIRPLPMVTGRSTGIGFAGTF